MRLLLIDLETTGLSTTNDRITELGFIFRDTNFKKPCAHFSSLVHDADYPKLTPFITGLTGLTDELLQEFGRSPDMVFKYLELFVVKHRPDYFVAHNGTTFDKPFLYNELARAGMSTSHIHKVAWLDTRTDIPFTPEPSSRRLIHLAAEFAGYVSSHSHSALYDCMTMDKLLEKYDLEEVLKLNSIPNVVIKALVQKENKDLAKFNGFRWDPAQIAWLRTIKQTELEVEKNRCKKIGFDIEELK